MPDPAAIQLPDDLRPSDGRFGSGPSKVRTDAVQRLAAAAPTYLGTSHRREGVRVVVRRIKQGLADLYSLPDGYEVLLGNGGTTAFWDAAAFGLIERQSEHLSFGEFTAKFAAVTRGAPHLEDPIIVESPPGTHPAWKGSDADTFAMAHNETSTGVTMPVEAPDGRSADRLLIVDATSAAGGIAVDLTQVDTYYFAPQKAFASEGGLWLALCSPAAIARIERIAATDRWQPPSLSLLIALENSRLDQTYNTPALATLFLLEDTIQWMLANGGLAGMAKRTAASANVVYGWADASAFATPFVQKPSERSPVTATIDFEGVEADDLAAALRANGIVDVESYRKLGRNQLRIAMFPAIETSDLEILTRAIDHIVAALQK
ncbi:MAG: phosphoserine transaminase [Actinobacteria bacterium]|nr:phosphoserine transaminase [Actinomycetota bacterium]